MDSFIAPVPIHSVEAADAAPAVTAPAAPTTVAPTPPAPAQEQAPPPPPPAPSVPAPTPALASTPRAAVPVPARGGYAPHDARTRPAPQDASLAPAAQRAHRYSCRHCCTSHPSLLGRRDGSGSSSSPCALGRQLGAQAVHSRSTHALAIESILSSHCCRHVRDNAAAAVAATVGDAVVEVADVEGVAAVAAAYASAPTL